MSKKKTKRRRRAQWILLAAVLVVALATALRSIDRGARHWQPRSNETPAALATNAPLRSTMELNTAVMVTVDLDFGRAPLPTIAEALSQIERRYQPADGAGRTFAILDAYGEPTPEGKLRISMHISSEKIGAGSLIFKPTGHALWMGIFNPMAPGKKPPAFGKALMIFVDNGAGKTWTIDGSSNPISILDATVKEIGQPLKEIWPDGQDREFTFIYSSCGCPVKVLVRREADRTRRVKDLPVIFPDDPIVANVIATLMGW